ncbi:hypothetical protein SAMN04488564_1193 [Lentzea waywayandensis]|uniref:Uncharacterized protein n=1 Tax=Lentzea waywayandensis TaxID=84724 RepID=A0A1I6FHG6_9PSEU|nr:hypothetical protein SAMN04488564_1193 [Lentzea waywayandensis]
MVKTPALTDRTYLRCQQPRAFCVRGCFVISPRGLKHLSEVNSKRGLCTRETGVKPS